MNAGRFLFATCSLALAFSPIIAHAQADTPPAHHQAQASGPAAPQLQAALRQLWLGHVTAARDYAFAVKGGDAKASQRAAESVVNNAKQLSDAVAGFYGPAAGQKTMSLLGGHWAAVKAMTDATAHHDPAASTKAVTALMTNAGEIAAFLAAANPYLPKETVRGLLIAHGGHHQAQITQVMSGDLQGEARTWTQMRAHMDTISDALAAAIAKQFPDKAS